MSVRKIRAGIVGAGFVGPLHVEALRRLGFVEIVGIADETRDIARLKADELCVERAYDDFEQLIADDAIEVVHNCTPNHLHFEINRQAVLAGKHVVSEKPLAMNSRESARLLALVSTRPVVHAVNFVHRGYPLVQQVRRMVETGGLGKVNLVHGSYLQDWLCWDTDCNWRVDPVLGGASRAVGDIGSHWLDLVQFMTCSSIVSVFADLKTVIPTRRKATSAASTFQTQGTCAECEEITVTTEDYGALLLRFANGASGTMLVSQVSIGRKNRLWFEVDGSQQAVAWDSEYPEQLWVGHRERANEALVRDPSLVEAEVRPYVHLPGGHPEGWPDALRNLMLNIYSFIIQGKDPRVNAPNFPTFEDGHRVLLIVEAAIESSGEGKWVHIAQ